MEPIKNLQPGSKIKVYIYNTLLFDHPVARIAELKEDGTFDIDLGAGNVSTGHTWKEFSETPREAIQQVIREYEEERSNLLKQILRFQRMLKQKYPIHPVLSKKEFAEKFPSLSENYRTEDLSLDELKALDWHAACERDKYNQM